MLRHDVTNLQIAEDKLKILKNQLLDKNSTSSIKFLDSCINTLKDEHNNTKHLDLSRNIKEISLRLDNTLIEEEKRSIKNEISRLKRKRIRYAPKNFPYNLNPGDIISVKFGYGYCNELSDIHYAIIVSKQIGSMYWIVPLSSEPNKYSKLYFDNLNLPSQKKATRSYVVINQARFVHYRRLEKILNVDEGKISLSKENFNLLKTELNALLTV